MSVFFQNLFKMSLLQFGLHATREQGYVRIKKMDDTHLQNSINYANRYPHPYWNMARPKFEAEVARRA